MFMQKSLPTIASKAPSRILIALQTEEWLAKKGIEEVPFHGVIIRDGDNKVVVSDVEKHSRKHSSSQVKKLPDAIKFNV